MIPQFTAELSLTTSRGQRSPAPRIHDDRAVIVPQQRLEQLGPLEATPPTIQCPGCFTHSCGFLGWSTCLTCC
jgi:hypothetical protein